MQNLRGRSSPYVCVGGGGAGLRELEAANWGGLFIETSGGFIT